MLTLLGYKAKWPGDTYSFKNLNLWNKMYAKWIV